MSDQPRCPLCGGASYLGHYELKCVACGLPEKYWPRIRELVAIRDAAVEWERDGGHGASYTALKLIKLARQEAEKGEKNVRKQK